MDLIRIAVPNEHRRLSAICHRGLCYQLLDLVHMRRHGGLDLIDVLHLASHLIGHCLQVLHILPSQSHFVL